MTMITITSGKHPPRHPPICAQESFQALLKAESKLSSFDKAHPRFRLNDDVTHWHTLRVGILHCADNRVR